jgi:hypothetical protein
MTVYVLMIFSGRNYIEGIYADQSEAEAEGQRLKQMWNWCDYTVIEGTVIGG